ncbi:hypothetical protein [Leptospira adleri]|uniref:Uncharacterized protein n=1 Tax=Leptospira adleri TaxID=2023186 RepID=A0A2M9YMF2_9LEPT|nr:hypothetical protein [Leptospira adleri]PJZ52725.1 hypothetical protein CH380_13290 [Leptospira adleri]PJZ61745.1 hypothetical protein CH376_11570 [Leptospira adleri]
MKHYFYLSFRKQKIRFHKHSARIHVILVFLLLFLSFSIEAFTIEVFVPLCNGAQLACGKGKAGDPRSLEGNLYWGGAFGAESFLKRSRGFKVLERKDENSSSPILRNLILERTPKKGETKVILILHAYAGDRIDDALIDFLNAAGNSISNVDLVVWAGHDRLMDRFPPDIRRLKSASSKPAVVLACESEKYFGPVLRSLFVPQMAMTRTFMAPEAYLLEALAATVAKSGLKDKKAIRSSLVAAYAKYQRISTRAAGTVFSKLE